MDSPADSTVAPIMARSSSRSRATFIFPSPRRVTPRQAIGGYEIDKCFGEFLSQPAADRKQVRKEYRDATVREAAAERAGAE
jgi:hypothetical protein